MKQSKQSKPTGSSIAERIGQMDWERFYADINANGCAVLKHIVTPEECRELAARYASTDGFRKRILMARHGFGRGEYQYWDYPLPAPVQELRTALYPKIAKVANDWNAAMKIDTTFPEELPAYLERCHQGGQTKPTPLLLQYDAGDYNCLHQDVYGDLMFPLQATILLSEPGKDFTGGEFVLTEQRPRMQSRAEVVSLGQGDAVIFAVRQRPVQGTRGTYRVNLRHGVSRIHSGRRHTLGIIFHDAK